MSRVFKINMRENISRLLVFLQVRQGEIFADAGEGFGCAGTCGRGFFCS